MKTNYIIVDHYDESKTRILSYIDKGLPEVIQRAEAIAIEHSSVAEIYQEQRKIVVIDRRGDK